MTQVWNYPRCCLKWHQGDVSVTATEVMLFALPSLPLLGLSYPLLFVCHIEASTVHIQQYPECWELGALLTLCQTPC